jgi:large subunit ribosomal protein L35
LCVAERTVITPRFRTARLDNGHAAAVAKLVFTHLKAWKRPAAAFGQWRAKMPKMKTKSGAKKRFKVTATGKVMHAQRGKRHGMIKRTNKQIRNLRGTRVLFKSDGETVKKYFLPSS